MIIGCKRPAAFFDEFTDPLGKRYRLPADTAEETVRAVAEAVVAAAAEATPSGSEKRRGNDIDECPVFADKRLRLSSEGQWVGGSSREAASQVEKEASVRGWADTMVRTLQGCPSVDEATHRCSRVLLDFEAEVRQEALQEARQLQEEQQSAEPPADELHSPEALQALQHKNSVLLRAVHHLAQRCKNIEVGSEEVTSLRAELENSQEQVRRLTHSNQVLQGHLRVHLDQSSSDLMGKGPHMLH
mmetsp:Transcript_62283/g.148680  ORF Transcript_62283/g.148680 Transcript_62283/m.148680 type:complete len:244 (-) Transcript_62283:87-818(-)